MSLFWPCVLLTKRTGMNFIFWSVLELVDRILFNSLSVQFNIFLMWKSHRTFPDYIGTDCECFLLFYGTQCLGYVAWNDRMDEWKKNWKDKKGKNRGLIEVLSEHLVGDIQENHENLRIIGVLAEIRTKQLPNISKERYHLSQFARWMRVLILFWRVLLSGI
jgi:hypothetical protein